MNTKSVITAVAVFGICAGIVRMILKKKQD